MKGNFLFGSAIGLFLPFFACSQPSFTANDVVPAWSDRFGYGANLGYFPPYYYDMELAALAHGTPDGKVPGIGVTAIRPGLFEHFLDFWGYDIRKPHFRFYDSIGLKSIVVIAGFPAPHHRDPAFHCPNFQSEVFRDLYEPIWDQGQHGTPVNEKNPFALYLWKAANTYKGQIKIWEIWNEPDIDLGGNAWKTAGMPGNWWENAPPPCETILRAPIYFYIRMLRIAYEVIKTVDPNAYVAVGGLGWPSYLDAICRYTDEPYEGKIDADKYPFSGGAYFDVMSFHSYPHLDNSLREWSNEINGFKYYRHSDAAVDGLWLLQEKFDTVLNKYGYNNLVYPEKIWICTEFNLPRKPVGDYIGSVEAQVNFLIKSLITAQMRKVVQMHVYSLADEKPEEEASSEFAFMGLFKNLNNVKPPDAEYNPPAYAVKTTQQLLGAGKYDKAQTEKLKLPPNIRGGAFRNGAAFTYVLWAVTAGDMDENAQAVYSFPPEFGLKFLEEKYWHYSRSGAHSLTNAKQVHLTGSPVFLTETFITNNYPKQPKVSPNPLRDGFGTLQFWVFEEGFAEAQIFDAKGALVQTLLSENLIEGPHARLFDLSAQPKGVYYIRVRTPESLQTTAFVKN